MYSIFRFWPHAERSTAMHPFFIALLRPSIYAIRLKYVRINSIDHLQLHFFCFLLLNGFSFSFEQIFSLRRYLFDGCGILLG